MKDSRRRREMLPLFLVKTFIGLSCLAQDYCLKNIKQCVHDIFFKIVYTLHTMGYCHCWKFTNLKFKSKHEEGEEERKNPTFTCSFFNYCMLFNGCLILGILIPVQIRNCFFFLFGQVKHNINASVSKL